MFKGIFDKKRASAKGERDQRTRVAASWRDSEALVDTAAQDSASAPVVDGSFAALARELSGLGQLEVSRAAKERGWASLQRELERRPVRVGAPVKGRSGAGPVRRWRWAIASAAAAVAVIAGVLGAYGGGAFTTVVDNGPQTTLTSVVSSNTTQPSTTVAPNTTDTTVSTGTTGSVPGTTGTLPTSPPTTGPGTQTTGPSTQITQPDTDTTPPSTSTTEPDTSTTGEQVMVSKQREAKADQAAIDLGLLVMSGNTTGSSALVDAQAQSSLVVMMKTLKAPYGCAVKATQTLPDGTVRVTLDMQDRASNGQGVLVEKILRFAIRVQLTAKGAVIVAITAG